MPRRARLRALLDLETMEARVCNSKATPLTEGSAEFEGDLEANQIDLNISDEDKAALYLKLTEKSQQENGAKKREKKNMMKNKNFEALDEIEPKIEKKQKVEDSKSSDQKTQVFKSLFHKDSDLKKDTTGDFLSRCSKWGLR